jgi:hypothetical protein
MSSAKNEKSPPMAGRSLVSYDDEGGVTPRPHAPFDKDYSLNQPSLSMNVSATL